MQWRNFYSTKIYSYELVRNYLALPTIQCAYFTIKVFDKHIIHYTYIPLLTWNIHVPGLPTLLVCWILIMSNVSDPGIVTKLTPSPALIPARALYWPKVLPVVHCILPSTYRNITNDSTPPLASTHWNVFV